MRETWLKCCFYALVFGMLSAQELNDSQIQQHNKRWQLSNQPPRCNRNCCNKRTTLPVLIDSIQLKTRAPRHRGFVIIFVNIKIFCCHGLRVDFAQRLNWKQFPVYKSFFCQGWFIWICVSAIFVGSVLKSNSGVWSTCSSWAIWTTLHNWQQVPIRISLIALPEMFLLLHRRVSNSRSKYFKLIIDLSKKNTSLYHISEYHMQNTIS